MIVNKYKIIKLHRYIQYTFKNSSIVKVSCEHSLNEHFLFIPNTHRTNTFRL